MFHAAWPASHNPALRPTRGSGLGAIAVPIGITAAAPPPDDDVACAHAVVAAMASASGNLENTGPVRWICARAVAFTNTMFNSSVGLGKGARLCESKRFKARGPES